VRSHIATVLSETGEEFFEEGSMQEPFGKGKYEEVQTQERVAISLENRLALICTG
jgi:hypothetical protein